LERVRRMTTQVISTVLEFSTISSRLGRRHISCCKGKPASGLPKCSPKTLRCPFVSLGGGHEAARISRCSGCCGGVARGR
jgi:hypothetical protein